jgi:hypothetical protein
MARWASWLLILGICLKPVTSFAEDDAAPAIVSYGLSGFGTGAAVGLASGFLATGKEFTKGEWKTLLWGTSIGALSGLGIGIAVGAIDAGTSPHGPGAGFYILRDMNLGFGVGALAGTVIGALVWLDNGRAKDVLIGMAWGTLIGAGTGLVLGILEGSLRKSSRSDRAQADRRRLWIDIGLSPGRPGAAPLPYPSLTGRF